MASIPSSVLRQRGLKDTLPRRAVLQALTRTAKPRSMADLEEQLRRGRQPIGIVTIYRVADALERAGLVHRHADGKVSACVLPDLDCHHVLLRCTSCDSVREAHDHAMCRTEEMIALRAGFHPIPHASEVLGLCSSCS